MQNLKTTPKNSTLDELQYFNTIGLIFENDIYLNRNNVFLKYKIEDIKRVAFEKQRNLNRNYFTFFISLLIAFFSYAIVGILGNVTSFGFLASVILFVYSFLNKSYSYQIFLITINQNIVSLLIDPDGKEQAFELVELINKKMKNETQYLKVS